MSTPPSAGSSVPSSSAPLSLVDRANAFMRTNSAARAKLQGALKKLTVVQSLSRRASMTEDPNLPSLSENTSTRKECSVSRLSDASDWDSEINLDNIEMSDSDNEGGDRVEEAKESAGGVNTHSQQTERASDDMSKYMAKTASKFAFSPEDSPKDPPSSSSTSNANNNNAATSTATAPSNISTVPAHSPLPPSKALPAYMQATASSKKRVQLQHQQSLQPVLAEHDLAAASPAARRISTGRPAPPSSQVTGRPSVGGGPNPTTTASAAPPSTAAVAAPVTPGSTTGRPIIRPKVGTKGKLESSKFQTLPSNFNPAMLKIPKEDPSPSPPSASPAPSPVPTPSASTNSSTTTAATGHTIVGRHTRVESAGPVNLASLAPPTASAAHPSAPSASSASLARRSAGGAVAANRSLFIETNSTNKARGSNNASPTPPEGNDGGNEKGAKFNVTVDSAAGDGNGLSKTSGSPPPMLRARSSSVTMEGPPKIAGPGRPSLSHGASEGQKFQHVNVLLAQAYKTVSDRENDLRLAAQIGSMLMEENQKLETICAELSQKIETNQREHGELQQTYSKLTEQYAELSKQNMALIHTSLTSDEKSSNHLDRNDTQFTLQELLRVELGAQSSNDVAADLRAFQAKLARERRQRVLQARTLQDALDREERRVAELQKSIEAVNNEKSKILDTLETIKSQQQEIVDRSQQRELELAQQRQQEQMATNRQFQMLVKELEAELEEEKEERQKEADARVELQNTVQQLKLKIQQLSHVDVPASPGIISRGYSQPPSSTPQNSGHIQHHHHPKHRANSVTSTLHSPNSLPGHHEPTSPLPITEEAAESPVHNRESEALAADQGGVQGMMSDLLKKKGKRPDGHLDDELKSPQEGSNDPHTPHPADGASNTIDQTGMHYIPEADPSSQNGPIMAAKKKKPNMLNNLYDSLKESRTIIESIKVESTQNPAVLELGNTHEEREAKRAELLAKIEEKKKQAEHFAQYMKKQHENEEMETAAAVERLLAKKAENEAKLKARQAAAEAEKRHTKELEDQRQRAEKALEEIKQSEARTAEDYVALLKATAVDIEGHKANIQKLNETITKKEAELSALKLQLTATEEKLKASQSSVDALQSTVQSHTERIASLESEIKTLHDSAAQQSQKYSDLVKSKEESEGKLKDLLTLQSSTQNKHDELSGLYQQSLAKVQSLEDEIRSLKESLSKEKSNNESLSSQLTQIHDEKKKADETIAQLNQTVRQLESQLAESQSKVKSYEEEIEKLKSSLKDTNEKLSVSEKNITILTGEKKQVELSLSTLQSEHQKTLAELESAKNDFDRVVAQVTDLTLKLSEAEQKIENDSRSLEKLQTTVTELQAKLASSEEEVKKTVGENSSLINELKDLKNKYNETEMNYQQRQRELEKQLEDKTAALKLAQSTAEDLESKLTAEHHRYEQLAKEKSDLSDRLASTEKDLNNERKLKEDVMAQLAALSSSSSAEIAQLQKDLQEKGERLTESESKIAKLESSLQSQQERVAALEKEKSSLEASLSALTTEHKSLQSSHSALQSDYAALQQSKADREKELQSLLDMQSSSSSDHHKELTTKLREEMDRGEKKDEELKSLRDVLRAEKENVDALSAQKNVLESKLAELTASCASKDDEIKKLHAELSSSSDQSKKALADLHRQLEEKEAEVSELEVSVTNEKKTNGSLQSENSTLQAQKSALEGKVAELTSKCSSQEETIGRLNNDLSSSSDESKQSIADLQLRLQESEAKCGALTAKVAQLESDNASLHEEKDRIQKLLDDAHKQNESISAQLEEARKSLESLQKDHSDVKSSLSSLEDDHKRLQEDHKALQENHGEIQSQHSKALDEKDAITQQLNEVKVSHDEKVAALASLQDQMKDTAMSQESAARSTIERLENEATEGRRLYETKIEELTSRISELESSIATLKEVNSQLQAEYSKAHEEKEEAKKTHETHKADMTKMLDKEKEVNFAHQENVSTLCAQINSLNETIQALKAEQKEEPEEMHTPTFDAPEILLSPFDSFVLGHIHNLLTQQWAVATSVLESTPEAAPGKWIPDSDLTHCAMCHVAYSLLVRRHHCRVCGTMACSRCTSHKIDVPKFKQPDARVCNSCFMVVQTVKLASDAVTSGSINLDDQPTIYSIANKQYQGKKGDTSMQLQHAVNALAKARGSIMTSSQSSEGKSSSDAMPLATTVPRSRGPTISLDRTMTFSDIGAFMSTTEGGQLQATHIPFGPMGSRGSVNQSGGQRKSTFSAVAAAKRGSVMRQPQQQQPNPPPSTSAATTTATAQVK